MLVGLMLLIASVLLQYVYSLFEDWSASIVLCGLLIVTALSVFAPRRRTSNGPSQNG